MSARTFVGHLKADIDPAVGYDVEELADLVAEHQGAVAGDDSTIEVTFDVEAPDMTAAVLTAQTIALDLITKVGAKVVDVARLEVITPAEQEAGLARPLIPELIGLTEVAEILGVSKQRVAQLRDRPEFPEPVAELASGPVWTRPSLNHFIEGWSRKPGRPKKAPMGDVGTFDMPVRVDVVKRASGWVGISDNEVVATAKTQSDAVRAARRASAKIDAASQKTQGVPTA